MKVRAADTARRVAGADYAHEAGEAFERALAGLIERWEAAGVVAPPPEVLVDIMFDNTRYIVPVASELGERVGPFYDTNGVRQALGGISKQAVDDRRRKATILAARTSDGRWVYPLFQFREGKVDPALIPSLKALAGAPSWSVALWWVTPNDDLEGIAPLDWVRQGRSPDAVRLSAAHTAAEWA